MYPWAELAPQQPVTAECLDFGNPIFVTDGSQARLAGLHAWDDRHMFEANREGCWRRGSFSAAQGRIGLNHAILAHNPEVAGSNPAPATRKSRSEA